MSISYDLAARFENRGHFLHEEMQQLPLIDLNHYDEATPGGQMVQRSFGDFNNAENLQEFKDSEVGRAQIAMINEEMGDCTLMPDQLDSLLWEAQLYQKSGAMEPRLTVVMEEDGFHFIDFVAPQQLGSAFNNPAQASGNFGAWGAINGIAPEEQRADAKPEGFDDLHNKLWNVIVGGVDINNPEVSQAISNIALGFSRAFERMEDNDGANIESRLLWEEHLTRELAVLDEAGIVGIADKVKSVGSSTIADFLEIANLEGNTEQGPVGIMESYEGVKTIEAGIGVKSKGSAFQKGTINDALEPDEVVPDGSEERPYNSAADEYGIGNDGAGTPAPVLEPDSPSPEPGTPVSVPVMSF
ncbi:MAG: hypothetical protein ACLFP8_07170 [Alphaproteobacteria bacterium]